MWAGSSDPGRGLPTYNFLVMTLRPLTTITTITVGHLLAFCRRARFTARNGARCRSAAAAAERAGRTAHDQCLRPTRCARRSASARSVRRAWAGASTTSRSPRAIRNIIYLGYAVGGVLKIGRTTARRSSRCSTNTPIASIGDIAIAPDEPEHRLRRHRRAEQPPDARRSATASTRSTDGGKTWHEHRPEGDADDRPHRHRSRRIPNTVYVAAPGHLFGPNPERGIYKTTDGGKTWTNWSSSSTRTPASPTSSIDPSNPEHALRGELPAAAHAAAASTAAARAAGSGRPRTAARRWTKLTATACRQAPTAASRSTSRARTRTSSTRRSRPVQVGSR